MFHAGGRRGGARQAREQGQQRFLSQEEDKDKRKRGATGGPYVEKMGNLLCLFRASVFGPEKHIMRVLRERVFQAERFRCLLELL